MRAGNLLVGGSLLVASGLMPPAVCAEADKLPLPGMTVTVKVPLSAMKVDSTSIWSGPRLVADVQRVDGLVQVNGDASWREGGFPWMAQSTVKKATVRKKENSAEVVLDGIAGYSKLTLTFRSMDANAAANAFAELVLMGPASSPVASTYLQQTYDLMADRHFMGPLAQLSHEQRVALLKFAHVAAAGTSVDSTTFKDQLYLRVALGSGGVVYNDLKLNQVQRVATVFNERILTILKAFALPVRDVPSLYGLKLELEIPHKSFLEEYAPPNHDRLEFYAPSELTRRFAESEITSQQLVDGSIVIVNNNRIALPLAN